MIKQRTFVLGLDGMPYTLLKDKFSKGEMKNLYNISKLGQIKQMNSVIPTISSVAWTSYATGKNSGEHNIFGFVDRNPSPFNIKIPLTSDRKEDTIWSKVSKDNKKTIVVNVPLTYPPEPLNGKMISCFLCTDIKKATYPKEFHQYLIDKEYIIDADAWLVKESKELFLYEIMKVLNKRFEVAFELFDDEEWDFFQLHIMETDRLMHFFWDEIVDTENNIFTDQINEFFKRLDYFIGMLFEKLEKEDRIIILSDHGFCGIKHEVQLNTWLEQEGFLRFDNDQKKTLSNYSKESICYSILPGRIYINLADREEKGTVLKSDYEKIRQKIKQSLLNIQDPKTKEPVIDKVFFREELYYGDYLDNAPDIIAHPRNGYDLKGSLDFSEIFTNSELNGMHTYEDAVIIGVNCDITKVKKVEDVAEVILNDY
ncbi:MAG: alkaline phosphatase family protein [Clostridiaceae bacterium]